MLKVRLLSQKFSRPREPRDTTATGEYVDLLAEGIVDPAMVTRTALQNAGSVAGLLLTTECMITDEPEEVVLLQQCRIWVVWAMM